MPPSASRSRPGPAPRPRGRPRSAAHDDAILGAAARLLGEVGYTRMSMEAVASAAGVSKPTLYLRYPGKPELAAAAFERVRMAGAPAPTGDLRADLAAQLRHVRDAFGKVGMSMVGVCLAEAEQVPRLIEGLRSRSLEPGRQLVRDMLEAARERGEIAPDADVETGIEMLFGAFYARQLAGRPAEPGWEEGVAGAVLGALGGEPASPRRARTCDGASGRSRRGR